MRADYALNEGGASGASSAATSFYLCAVGEKMSAPFRIHVRGRSGHASMPSIADNALVKAAPIIEALGRYQPPQALIPEVRALPRARARRAAAARGRARAGAGAAPARGGARRAAALVHARPDADRGLEAAERDPGRLRRHGRLPPAAGMTPEDVDPLVRAAIGPGRLRARVVRARRRHALAARDAALVGARALGRASSSPARGSRRSSAPGFTDSHWMREAFGTVAYGFFPQKTMDARARRPARPLRRRADPGRRSRARRRALRSVAVSLGA